MGIHGGLDETSMMLHLRPELVDLRGRLPQRARGVWRPTATSASAARSRSAGCRTTSARAATSAIPTGATAERGKQPVRGCGQGVRRGAARGRPLRLAESDGSRSPAGAGDGGRGATRRQPDALGAARSRRYLEVDAGVDEVVRSPGRRRPGRPSAWRRRPGRSAGRWSMNFVTRSMSKLPRVPSGLLADQLVLELELDRGVGLALVVLPAVVVLRRRGPG